MYWDNSFGQLFWFLTKICWKKEMLRDDWWRHFLSGNILFQMSQQTALELLRQAAVSFEMGNSVTTAATWQLLPSRQGPKLPQQHLHWQHIIIINVSYLYTANSIFKNVTLLEIIIYPGKKREAGPPACKSSALPTKLFELVTKLSLPYHRN